MRVLNEGGAIEAQGALRLAADRVENLNAGLVTREAADPPVYEEWIQPRWSAKRYPRSSCWGIGGGQDKNGCAGHPGPFEDYTWYRVWVTRTRTVVDASAPGRILAGGDLRIEAGRLDNADSHIVAGGALDIVAAEVDHRATQGKQVASYTGGSAFTWVEACGLFGSRHCRRWTPWIPYTPAPAVEAVYDLPTLQVAAGTAPAGTGTDPGAREAAALARGPEAAPAAAPAPDLVLPPSALVVVAPDPAGPYLETDPRFADRGRWLSSGYLLERLGLDPAAVQRRLGDGLIEQRLVREQLLALRGALPAPDPRDGEAWYRALLEAGATVARRLGLRPGIALTPEQVAALTSDIVWLVERTVRLPDGRTVRALVPQVYVVPRAGDLDGRGSLLAGRTLELAIDGRGRLGGAVAGRRIVVRADELLQTGRLVAAGEAVLATRGDLRVEGGRLRAGARISLEAGRDLAVASTVRRTEAGGGRYRRAAVERLARLYVAGEDGQGLLALAAARDVRLVAAELRNDAAGGLTVVAAGRDLALEARAVGWSERTVWDARNRLVQGERREAGTRIEAAGDLALAAGRELAARAARVRAEGEAALAAGGALRLEAGARETWWEEARHRRSRGLLGRSERASLGRVETRAAEAAVVGAGRVSARAGGDLVLRGAAVAADGDVRLSAGGDLRLEAAATARREVRIERRRRAGVFRGPGLGVTIGRERVDTRTETRTEGAAPSAVGSLGGDVRLAAGGAYRQRGGTVSAPRGDVRLEAAEVDIAATEARRETRWSERREVRGLSVSVSNPVVTAARTVADMAGAASATDDARVRALAGLTAGFAVWNAKTALAADPKRLGGVRVSLLLGSGRSEASGVERALLLLPAEVSAGGDVVVRARGGAGQGGPAGGEGSGEGGAAPAGAGDLAVRGSLVRAGGDVVLEASRDVALEAGEERFSMSSRMRSRSAGAGLGLGAGGLSVEAQVSVWRGGREVSEVRRRLARAEAGGRLEVRAGRDVRLVGAVGAGGRVAVRAGRDLEVRSVQDEAVVRVRERGAGGSLSVGLSGRVSASAWGDRTDLASRWRSVVERTGLRAGAGGFDVEAGGTTRLVGGAIVSAEAAVEAERNRLRTGRLEARALRDEARWRGRRLGASVGWSGRGATVGEDAAGRAQAGGAGREAGRALPEEGGWSAGVPMALEGGERAARRVRAALSPARVEVGDGTEVALLDLDRGARTEGEGPDPLGRVYEEGRVRAAFEVGAALAREAERFLNDRAREAAERWRALEAERRRQAASGERDEARLRALHDELERLRPWLPGGAGRRVVRALVAAAGGNVAGPGAAFVRAAAVRYLQGLGAAEVRRIADALGSEGARAALHAIVGCAGSAGAGGSCASGALGAAAGSVLNGLLTVPGDLDPEGRRARAALVESVVGGIAAAAGLDVAEAAVGSRIEGEENALFVLAIPVALELVDKGIQAYEAWSLAAALKEGRDEEAAEIAAGIAIGLATDGVPGNKLIQIGARKLRKILVRHGWGARAEKITSKAERLAENRAAGKAFEMERVRELEKAGHRIIETEVLLETRSGTRVRMDILVKDRPKGWQCIECKASSKAPLTRNQKRAFPEIEKDGAVVVSKDKSNLPKGSQIPPQKVRIDRKGES